MEMKRRSEMHDFAQLIWNLGTSTKNNAKLQALVHYFSTASDADKVWVIAIFSGRRPKRTIPVRLLSQWCMELTDIPRWLFDESYLTVGDLAETIALLLPPAIDDQQQPTLSQILNELLSLQQADESARKEFVLRYWQSMSSKERFVFNKLITGGFRIGVSQKMMVNALAATVHTAASTIAHRISGQWDPSAISFRELLSEESIQNDYSKPYPFFLAYAIENTVDTLGIPHEWQAEWKWDGIRGQLIKRNDEWFVWSRGEELMTEKFPEYQPLKDLLPNGTVIDGEIITAKENTPLPFNLLQTRIGRKNVTKQQLREAPVSFFAYDLLEWEGNDIRTMSLFERRTLLEKLIHDTAHPALLLSENISFESWQTLEAIRETARINGAEGIMLKRKSSGYQTGRKKGDWWKWKIDPLTIDAVLVYAQKGHGRRSNIYTDYTFAVRNGEELVTFAKAYSGLTDKEFAQVDAFVKRNSLEKFGPVRTVKPELVFEIAFEGIAASNRHKSGVALRFPRIHRWRQDKTINDINTLADLKELLILYGNEPTTL